MKDKICKWVYYILIAIIIIFGIFIRTKLYIMGNVFEDDECRLALGIMDKPLWKMFLPLGPYSSSPLFVFVSKIIAECTNYNELALKFLSYICSIASIGLLYKICTTYFNRKISVIITLFLFVVNYQNIYFSSIFKTYSLEIFLSLLCIHYFPKINIANLNYKKALGLSAICIVLTLLSLPSLFFIGTLFLINIYHNYNNKQFYKKLFLTIIPFLIAFGIYYHYNLLPTKIMQLEEFTEFWQGVFSAGFMSTLAATIQYLFFPNRYILCIVILLFISTIQTICNKNEHTDFNIYLFSIFFLSFLASLIHLYPIALGRTAMFLLPILLLIIIRTLDVLNLKKIHQYLLLFMLIFAFYVYLTPSYITKINNVLPSFRNFAPQSLMQEMAKNFNPETDKIVTTKASVYSYGFYAIKNNFIHKWYIMENEKNTYDNANKIYYNYYNKLDKNKNYWFYLIKEYDLSPQLVPTLDWLKHQNILYSKKELGSYLFYISGIKEVQP